MFKYLFVNSVYQCSNFTQNYQIFRINILIKFSWHWSIRSIWKPKDLRMATQNMQWRCQFPYIEQTNSSIWWCSSQNPFVIRVKGYVVHLGPWTEKVSSKNNKAMNILMPRTNKKWVAQMGEEDKVRDQTSKSMDKLLFSIFSYTRQVLHTLTIAKTRQGECQKDSIQTHFLFRHSYNADPLTLNHCKL